MVFHIVLRNIQKLNTENVTQLNAVLYSPEKYTKIKY